MSDVLKRYGWLGKWLMAAFVVGTAWTQIVWTQNAFADRLAQQELTLAALNKERSEILVMLGRLEERIKSIQDQMHRKP